MRMRGQDGISPIPTDIVRRSNHLVRLFTEFAPESLLDEFVKRLGNK